MTILFFDDWTTQESRGLERRWFKAEPWPGIDHIQDKSMSLSLHHTSIIRNEDNGLWRMWSYGRKMISSGGGSLPEAISATCLYESEDGLEWVPAHFASPVDARAGKYISNAVFSGQQGTGGAFVFRDDLDEDHNRRYKMVYVDALPENPDISVGQIACSPDGVNWKEAPGVAWSPSHVDTFHCTQWNPFSGRWQWTTRSISGDRRIALFQTSDFREFEGPLIVLHPDPCDPPCVEFYGMPHFFYEGYAVGFLWRMHSTYDEVGTPHRMRGKIDCELAYSVNGVTWNRTNRESFLPDYGFGATGYRMVFPSYLIEDDDGWLRVYTSAFEGEHNDGSGKIAQDEPRGCLTISRFRRDGFCALETVSDTGHLTLRAMMVHGGEIRLNAVTAKYGSISAELRNVPDDTPIDGYEIENCIPVEGDGHFLALRWKDKSDIDSLQGKPFRIHLKLNRARLYAVRVDADYIFGTRVHVDLAGTAYPESRSDLLPK